MKVFTMIILFIITISYESLKSEDCTAEGNQKSQEKKTLNVNINQLKEYIGHFPIHLLHLAWE